MQLAGGAGLAIIMLAAIAGPVGPGLYIAERSGQLVPHVRRSAKLIMVIYAGYALGGVLAYWLAGMNLFDAINHAFPAVSTGGFSTQPESIGHWDSAVIESVSIVLMLLGNLNFLTAYWLLHGKFKAVYRNGEVRLMAVLIPACALVLLLLVCRGIYPTLSKSVRVAIFETISALTTTGFSTVSYGNWKSIGVFVLTVLMLIGGGTCSTAGGIKQYRVYLLFKALWWELRRPLLPRTTVVENYVWQGEQKDFINDERIRQVATFLFLYLVTYTVGSSILAVHGYGIGESLFEFASALSTVGLSVGVTTAGSPPLALWTETLGMFLGRLELFIVFVSLAKIARDSFAMLHPNR
jgi:trk system potassium uptake protein TrkH